MSTPVAMTTNDLDSPEQSGHVGLWIFILSEIMLFGGFIAGYITIRWGSAVCALGTPAWPKPGYAGGLALAALNTVFLLTSSLTIARASVFAKEGKPALVSRHLLYTLLLGLAFLVIKGFEYHAKMHHGYFPGSEFLAANPGMGIFVSFYFALTGLHGLHILVGLLWMFFLRQHAGGTAFPPRFAKKVEYAGLYWHFVDIIWVILFPLFYLI